MRSVLRYLPLLALGFGAACSSDLTSAAPTEALAAKSLNGSGNGPAIVTVYTQNMYIGLDVDAVIIAINSPDPTDDLPALLNALATIQHTDLAARVNGMAAEIARTHPHVVGLQEVSKLDIELPPLGVSLHEDFLAALLAALNAKGLNYVVGGVEDNIDATPMPGIELIDRDVILVDADRVQVTASAGHRFTYNLGVVAPGVDLERGWVQITAVIGGRTFEISSLHTEGTGSEAALEDLHASQILDVVTSMGSASPAIVIGDFNAQPTSLAYQVMLGGGFADVWSGLHPGAKGLTFGHVPDLSDSPAKFYERIDYVWTRGLGDAKGPNSLQGQIDRYGDTPGDRVRNAEGQLIWPSDHTGLVANVMTVK